MPDCPRARAPPHVSVLRPADAYRLCPADQPLTEACFQSNHLEFVQEKQALLYAHSLHPRLPLLLSLLLSLLLFLSVCLSVSLSVSVSLSHTHTLTRRLSLSRRVSLYHYLVDSHQALQMPLRLLVFLFKRHLACVLTWC